MSEPAMDDVVPHGVAHRELAVATFNASWTLLEKERDDDEDLELLEVAFTSRHHWRVVGGAQQCAIADWMVSRCFAELGDGELAVRFARSAIASEPPEAPAWLHASLFEGLARAHAARGDRAERGEAFATATAALAKETHAESRQLIHDQLATVPEVVSSR